jgi:hypothetical protein
MPQVGFEPTIPANAGLQTYALDRAVTGIGFPQDIWDRIVKKIKFLEVDFM